MQLPTHRLADVLNGDPEFAFAARLWDADIRYVMGADSFIVTIRAGIVTGVKDAGLFDPWSFSIAASDEVWENILSAQPGPMYQDLFPAQFHKGLRMEGDLESLYAYYAAVRRTTDLLRALNTDAASAA